VHELTVFLTIQKPWRLRLHCRWLLGHPVVAADAVALDDVVTVNAAGLSDFVAVNAAGCDGVAEAFSTGACRNARTQTSR